MKAMVSTQDLREAFNKVNTIKSGRGNATLPVLSYAKLSINGSGAKLITTDLEKAVEVNLKTEGDDNCEILLPKKKMQIFLNGANGNVGVKVDRKGVVTCSRGGLGEVQYKPYSIKDFPLIPQPKEDTVWSSIDAKWFIQMLDILLTGCAKEDSRPILTGICFSEGAMASADGFRLVTVENEKLNIGLEDKRPIIPFQTLELIKRVFGKEESIQIGFHHPDRVHFKSPTALLTSQLIQGNYPNWQQIIPNKYDCRVSYSAPLMMQRLKMIDPASLSAGFVRLQFTRTDKQEHECLISGGTRDEDYAEYYSMRMPVKIETESESKIAFNYKYLCDAMKPFSICNLELTSPSSPGKITGDIEGLTITVMPMFIQW